jgi:hypothetical protein
MNQARMDMILAYFAVLIRHMTKGTAKDHEISQLGQTVTG